jgi:hypothetical protein
MKVPLSILLWLCLALFKVSSAQQIAYPNTDYYGEQQPAQDASSSTSSTEGQAGDGQTSTSTVGQGGGGQAEPGSQGGQDGGVAPTKPVLRPRQPRVRGPAVVRHQVDYTQPDPNPYNNEYPCQGPWYECVGMDKNDCFIYIKERLKYCGDTETKVMMYPKSEGEKNRVFVHVNSDGAITKAAAA